MSSTRFFSPASPNNFQFIKAASRVLASAVMNQRELRERSMRFAVTAVKWCRSLPATWEARRVGGQLIDSATSVAINYRACGRSRSQRDFISKIGIVVEEADECVGWLDMIQRLELSPGPEYQWLAGEAAELLAIFSASQLTAKRNYQRSAVIKGAEPPRSAQRSAQRDPGS